MTRTGFDQCSLVARYSGVLCSPALIPLTCITLKNRAKLQHALYYSLNHLIVSFGKRWRKLSWNQFIPFRKLKKNLKKKICRRHFCFLTASGIHCILFDFNAFDVTFFYFVHLHNKWFQLWMRNWYILSFMCGIFD